MANATKRFSDYDFNDTETFKEATWKCTTNESCYTSGTLIGNWNESRYDVKYMTKNKPLPSRYNHYFETSHKSSYKGSQPMKNLSTQVKLLGVSKEARIFPVHQPELVSSYYKQLYNNFESTSTATYTDPNL